MESLGRLHTAHTHTPIGLCACVQMYRKACTDCTHCTFDQCAICAGPKQAQIMTRVEPGLTPCRYQLIQTRLSKFAETTFNGHP